MKDMKFYSNRAKASEFLRQNLSIFDSTYRLILTLDNFEGFTKW